MAKALLPFFFCLLALSYGVLAERQHQQPQQQNECRLDRLNALEPTNRIQSEAGLTEIWDPNENEFQCAGVALMRRTIEPNGLLLPFYRSTPELVYVIEGRGIHGMMVPGCPETFQSVPQRGEGGRGQESEGRRRFHDQHQKIRRFRQGDILALPAGLPHWVFNDGDEPLVVVVLLDSTNRVNQLDQSTPRTFFLAGNPQQEFEQFLQGGGESRRQIRGKGQQGSGGKNILAGFNAELLQQVFGLPEETIRRIQSEQGDERGHIVRAERLRVIRPPTLREEEEWEERRYGGRGQSQPRRHFYPGREIRGRRPGGEQEEEEGEEEWGTGGPRVPYHHGGGRGGRSPREWYPRRKQHQGVRYEEESEERGSTRYPGIEEEGSSRYSHRGGRQTEQERRQHGGGGRWEEQTEEERRQYPHRGQQQHGRRQWEEQGEEESQERYPYHRHRGQQQHGRREWEEQGEEKGQERYPYHRREQHHGRREEESEERWKREQREERGREGWPGKRGVTPRWETGRRQHCRCEEDNTACEVNSNDIQETICSVKLGENIDDPSSADVFVPQAGRLTTLNSFNLPVLSYLRLNAEKGVLYRNAIATPKYTLNAHTILYVTRGRARIQVVNERGENVFDDEVRENQVVVVPQGFADVKQASEEGFEWVGFKTNDMARVQPLVGRTSALRALPVEVVMNAYQIEREEAKVLKYGREETLLLAPSTGGRREMMRGERRAVA